MYNNPLAWQPWIKATVSEVLFRIKHLGKICRLKKITGMYRL